MWIKEKVHLISKKEIWWILNTKEIKAKAKIVIFKKLLDKISNLKSIQTFKIIIITQIIVIIILTKIKKLV